MNTPRMYHYLKLNLLSLAALAVCVPVANAATLFSDNFTGVTSGASLNSAGWYFYSNGGAAWGVTTDNTAPLSGDALTNQGGSAANTLAYKQFSTASLSVVGDYIEVSIDLHTATTASGAFGFGLLNSDYTFSANVLTGTNPALDGDGYRVAQSVSASATAPFYSEMTNMAATTLLTASQTAKINDNLGRTYTLKLTKVATGVEIESSLDGVLFDSTTDSTGSIYSSFNTLFISAPLGSTAIKLDNISVITGSNIPEPSSIGMIVGLLAGGSCLLKRRRSLRA